MTAAATSPIGGPVLMQQVENESPLTPGSNNHQLETEMKITAKKFSTASDILERNTEGFLKIETKAAACVGILMTMANSILVQQYYQAVTREADEGGRDAPDLTEALLLGHEAGEATDAETPTNEITGAEIGDCIEVLEFTAALLSSHETHQGTKDASALLAATAILNEQLIYLVPVDQGWGLSLVNASKEEIVFSEKQMALQSQIGGKEA